MWKSLFGLKTALALRADPAWWRAISSRTAASRNRSLLILSSNDCLKIRAPHSPTARKIALSSIVRRKETENPTRIVLSAERVSILALFEDALGERGGEA